MRFVMALVIAALAYEVIPSETVAYIVIGISWLGLAIYSPPYCPHCKKTVVFSASTCGHCGKPVKES